MGVAEACAAATASAREVWIVAHDSATVSVRSQFWMAVARRAGGTSKAEKGVPMMGWTVPISTNQHYLRSSLQRLVLPWFAPGMPSVLEP